MTGPVAVRGAKPGDVLEVRIKDVELRQNWGWNRIRPLGGGLPEDFPEGQLLHIKLDKQKMLANLPWGVDLPLSPFFGVMGVAPPKEWGRITSIIPRAHGGNMDNKELGAGCTLYLPVFNEGALFSAGDGHALQGDGEVNGTAIEISLTPRLQFIVHPGAGQAMRWPRAEDARCHYVMAMSTDLDEACRLAVGESVAFLQQRAGLSAAKAYALTSLSVDLRIAEAVNHVKVVYGAIPKTLIV
jgi:acetamidase/formamidase